MCSNKAFEVSAAVIGNDARRWRKVEYQALLNSNSFRICRRNTHRGDEALESFDLRIGLLNFAFLQLVEYELRPQHALLHTLPRLALRKVFRFIVTAESYLNVGHTANSNAPNKLLRLRLIVRLLRITLVLV